MGERRVALGAITMALVACALPVAGMTVAGIAPWDVGQGPDDQSHEAQQPPLATVSVQPTPATAFLDELANQVETQWDVSGWIEGARPPHPLLCGTQHDPAGSFSVTMTEGDQAQLYALTYSAGLGATELEAQVDAAGDCARSATSSPVDLGTEGYDVASMWSGDGTITRAWRHGDVILYVSSDSASTVRNVAGRLDEMATDLLDGQCLDPASVTQDAARSPLHDYEGWLVDHEVTIPEPEHTEATRLPAPLDIAEVNLPLERAYPVWPPLPDPVDKPVEPARPQWPDTSTMVRVTQEDPDGPGCGWAFTGQAAPTFDADAVEKVNDQVIAAARGELEAGVDAWRRDLTEFWRAWPHFLTAADEYAAYGQQVAAVQEAWRPIDAAWRAYRAQEEAYQQDLESYHRVLDIRRQLTEQYDEHVAQCLDAAEVVDSAPDTPQPVPSPTQEPPDETADTAHPDEPEATPRDEAEESRVAEARALLESCPPQRPEQLNQPEPDPPVAPVPPKDPRPASSGEATAETAHTAG